MNNWYDPLLPFIFPFCIFVWIGILTFRDRIKHLEEEKDYIEPCDKLGRKTDI